MPVSSTSLEPTHVAPAPSAAGARLDFLWLEVTGKCNLRCVHCYADSGPHRPLADAMTPDDWEGVLAQAADLGCRAVQFIGGEPTMHPALPALIERARALGFAVVEVYTNGTLFKPDVKAAFLRHEVALAFSVYSAVPEVHDRVTQQPGSLERTLESIRWAVAAGLPVRVGIIEMDENAGETDRTREMLHGLGVTSVGVDAMRGVGRGGPVVPPGAQLEELCGACARGKLAVTATGQVFPCVFSRAWPVGHVREGLPAVVGGAALRDFRVRMAQVHAERDGPERLASDPPGPSPASPTPPCAPTDCGPTKPKPPKPPKPGSCSPNPVCTPNGLCEPDFETAHAGRLANDPPDVTPASPTPPCRPSDCRPVKPRPGTCEPRPICEPDNICEPDFGCTPDDNYCEPDFGKPRPKGRRSAIRLSTVDSPTQPPHRERPAG